MNIKNKSNKILILIISIILLIKIVLLFLYTNQKIEKTEQFNIYKENFLKADYIKNNYKIKEYVAVSKRIVNSKKELSKSIFDKNDIYIYDEKDIIINYENTNSKYIINNQKEKKNIINLTFKNKDSYERKYLFVYKYDNIYNSDEKLLIKYVTDIQLQFIPISIYSETIEFKNFIIDNDLFGKIIYVNIIYIILFILIYYIINKYVKEQLKKILVIILSYIYIFNFEEVLYFISNLNIMFNNLFILVFFIINYFFILYLLKNKLYKIFFLCIIIYLIYQSLSYKNIFYIDKKNDIYINKLIESYLIEEIYYKENCIIINNKKICFLKNEIINKENEIINKENEIIYIKKEILKEKRNIFLIEQTVYENYKTKEKIYILNNLTTTLFYNKNYKNKKINEQFILY